MTPTPTPRIPEPELTYLEGDQWRLESDVRVASRGAVLFVPAGFTTDLASIPRALWGLIAPFELSCVAPIVHDWLYRHGGRITSLAPNGQHMPRAFTRADADDFLRDIAEQEGVPEWRCRSAYYAVRLFGGSSWQSTQSNLSPPSTP